MYPGSRSLDAGYAQTGVGGFGFPSSGCPVTLRVLNPDQMERGVGAQFFRGGLVKRKKKEKKALQSPRVGVKSARPSVASSSRMEDVRPWEEERKGGD